MKKIQIQIWVTISENLYEPYKFYTQRNLCDWFWKWSGVPIPPYETMIHLASVVNDTDFYTIGRVLEKPGVTDLSLEELKQYFLDGRRP